MKNRSFSKTRSLSKSRSALVAASALSFVAFAVGCSDAEDVSSTDVKTGGMFANYEALDTGNGEVVVRAELRVGGDDGTYVRLLGEDELVAAIDGDEKTMGEEEGADADRVWYESPFSMDDSSGVEVSIAFNRGEDDTSAPDSFVEMPPAFALSIDGDADAGDDIQRGEDVVITWDTEFGGILFWELDGSCVWNKSGEVDDSDTLVLGAEELEVTASGEGEECEVTVTIERRTGGDVDPAFDDGRFIATQRRAITFNSTPADDEGSGAGGAGN